jgi:hypothetical protein
MKDLFAYDERRLKLKERVIYRKTKIIKKEEEMHSLVITKKKTKIYIVKSSLMRWL